MPIHLTCSCGKQLRVADEFAGRQGQCPACGTLLEIPHGSTMTAGAGPSVVETEQAVTATPERSEPPEADSPEHAVSPLLLEPMDWSEDALEVKRPEYKLFSPGSIGAVAFLAGPVGAFALLTINFWRLGKIAAAWATIVIGVVTVAAVIAISLVLPESVPAFSIALPLFLALWAAAKATQGAAFDAHLRNGGERASGWAAVGIALLGAVVYLGVFFVVFFAYNFAVQEGFGEKVEFGRGEEIYYAKGATEADARALGTFLREVRFFDGKGAKSVRITIDDNRVVIGFIVQDWVLRDFQVQQEFRNIGQQASQRAFGGRPVTVELCDEYFDVKKRL